MENARIKERDRSKKNKFLEDGWIEDKNNEHVVYEEIR
jgi:hypothetical protein